MIYDYIVVGAGLSGLTLATSIKESSLGSVLVLEKSRGVGGRMATRRTLETRFDHGAQFYKKAQDIHSHHVRWSQKNISHHWFDSDKGEHWCAPSGMTALAKDLAGELMIELEKLVAKISFHENLWTLHSDKNQTWQCRHLILSCPLPQSVKLLSDLAKEMELIDSKLLSSFQSISYTKALIGLIQLEHDLAIDPKGYQEFRDSSFFSIANQKQKGVSQTPALTLTMSPSFSEEWFEKADADTTVEIQKLFLASFPLAQIKGFELKKWRYCQPLSQHHELFSQIAPSLFVIGDAFGGSSLRGAVRSAQALSAFLNR